MILLREKNTLKRYLRYIFFVTLILWTLTTIYVIYQYLWSSSKQVITKWWTFVEWIFNTTSFLPYLSNDWQSKFYQGFMFDKCLDFEINEQGNPEYKNKLCEVTTRDYKTYYASINTGSIRSDWVPLSIDDIYFTYNEIIKNNKLWLSHLNKYSNIQVDIEWGKIKVVFKNSSEDNTLFFTNYILPKHALIEPNLEMYQQSFAIEPVYNNCAKIKSQSTDQYSLIFDLSECEDTNLWFYQIKNTVSFNNFKDLVQQMNWSIVDIYVWNENLKWYQNINLESNKLIALFFNTKSPKMTVRLRRALWWLINHNFFKWDDDEYMKKYDRDIFTSHASTWENIQNFVNRISVERWLSKQELSEGWVNELTWNINFTEKHKVFAFYTEDEKQNFTLKLNFESSYDKIAIQHNSWDLYYPSSYSSKNKTTNYSISKSNNNLNELVNNYIIFWFNKDKKEQIWTINLYNIYKNSDTEWVKEQLKILYFDNNLSNYIVWRLKQIFKEHEISDSFIFEKITDTNQLEWKLTAWEYDIFINTIDMGLTTDISKLFSTENSLTNPSQYTDARLVSLLKQYNESKNKSKISSEINKIYSNDMPMVVLWRQYVKLNVKENIVKKLDLENINLYEYNRRDEIYKKLSLTENVYIDKEKVKDLKNFLNFLKDPK